MKSTISIITVNYNSLSSTLDLLKSLDRLNLNNLEIIVVDNASTHNPEAEILDRFPDVKVIVSKENLGFSGGNNLGIDAAKGEYVFFLNNDTELKEDIITPMVQLMSINYQIGILCPKICDSNSPHRVQYSGFTEIDSLLGRNRTHGNPEGKLAPYTTGYPHGAAMMVRRSTIDKIGHMPVDYFLYYEELDWGQQIRKAGYSIVVDPRVTVYHKESASVGTYSPMKAFYHSRNRMLFMRRNSKGVSLMIFMIYFLLVATPKALVEFMIYDEKENGRSFMRGLWLFRLPTFVKSTQMVPNSTLLSTVS